MDRWNPLLLTGNNYTNILAKIRDIKSILEQIDLEVYGLMSGSSGVSLFFLYYYEQFNEREALKCALKLLDTSIEKINNSDLICSYSNGLAGFGCILIYAYEKGILNDEDIEILDDVDAAVSDFLNNEIEEGRYDFLHGAIGAAYYFTKRIKSKPSVVSFLKNFVFRLKELSRTTLCDERFWLDREFFWYGSSRINIGLAHGLPSIVGFLLKCVDLQIERNLAIELINSTTKFILNCQQEVNENNLHSLFPNIYNNDIEPQQSRLAWCYGDLGIGLTLWRTGRLLGNEVYSNIGNQIFKHNMKRISYHQTGLVDCGICHGTLGVAHLYNRMFHYTGDKLYKNHSLFWINNSLSNPKFKETLDNCQSFNSVVKAYENNYSLIDGASGIGLCLLSTISKENPSWDSFFLLS